MIKSFTRIKTLKNIKSKQTKAMKKRTLATQMDLENDLLKKFTSFMSKQHLNFLKSKFYQYYGKNFAISYKKNYGFEEQWQGFLHNQEQVQKLSIFQNENSIFTAVHFIIMAFNTVVIWLDTIETFFMAEDSTFTIPELFVTGMALELSYFVLKLVFKKRKADQSITAYQILQTSYKNLAIFIYFLLKLLQVDKSVSSILWYCIQALCIYLMFKRASNIYSSFKLMNIALIYEYQFKIIDIVLNLVIIAHFVAIILYESTRLNFENSWTKAAGIEDESPMIKYIYSFYFCCTTILTVGYGDLSPKNYVEVIIVTLVQIFGIIAFAYFISEIGYSLSAMRKTNESMEKDLLIIQKIKRWYKLDEELARRARSHIINNKVVDSQLHPEEENGLLLKLSEDLRQEIKGQNAFKIVKSSIFFLLRWSISFQNAVSLRLCSIISPPGELLYQPQGKQRIYIIREGKIDIYASKRGSKRGSNATILKTIENQLSKEVGNNAYGYTAVFSHRPVQLYAITKRHTSGYYIQKDRFLECIHERQTDFEFYHEFKDKLDLVPCWESFQVPHLASSKHHYNPTHAYILRKHNKQRSKQSQRNFLRNTRRKFQLRVDVNHQEYQLLKGIVNTQTLTSSDLPVSKRSLKEMLQDIDEASTTERCVDAIKYFHHFFESSKEYSNYFSNNNRSRVLRYYEMELGVAEEVKEECVHSNFFDALKEYREGPQSALL